jgi:curved DNA-binding protein CbpA
LGQPAPGAALEPDDAFVLARIDGNLDLDELGLLLGFTAAQLDAALGRLEAAGLIEVPGRKPPAPRPRVASLPEVHAVDDASDQLEEVVDLDKATQTRVLEMYLALANHTHYEILGLPRDADKKAVKRAYFALAGTMHPDRHFRKNLGSFKAKMELVFARVTEAHDVLSDAKRRAEYDNYLAAQSSAAELEAKLTRGHEQAQAAAAAVASLAEQEERELAAALLRANNKAVIPVQGGQSGSGSLHSSATPSQAPTGEPKLPVIAPPRTPAPAVDEATRRAALASRLLGGRRPPTASSPKMDAVVAPERPQLSSTDAVEALRKRYQDRVQGARTSQLNEARSTAERCLAAGDYVGALNAYRLAAVIAPEDREIAQALVSCEVRASQALAAQYRAQAEYEEGANRWEDAARSWKRLAANSPQDAHVQLRAALALTKVGQDFRDAIGYAQRAVELEPGNAAHHVALGRLYFELGLIPAARSSTEHALKLAPGDLQALALQRKVTESLRPKS